MRELAMNKQSELHRLVMKLQMEQMVDLRKWMTEAEDRLAIGSTLGQNKDEVLAQIDNHEKLLADLESKQAMVSSISNFILVDSEDTSELEDQLTALGERWVTLCKMCEERYTSLQQLETQWSQLEQERFRLQGWMTNVEESLRAMERDMGVDTTQLLEQVKQVMVSRK